jgi:hypothetical protein
MIKKVNDINLVPDDIQELLIPETGEYVPINKTVYEIFPFSITQYMTVLSFIGKYFNTYNSILGNGELNSTEFFGLLAGKIIESNLLFELFKIFPDIKDDIAEITKPQLIYLLSVIYKMNFMVKKNIIANLQTRTAMNKMLEMMGLTILNQ